MHKAFKYRIYPTKEQQNFLAKHFGSTRFIYNYFLNNRKSQYSNNKKSLGYFDDAKLLTDLKKKSGYEWLADINSQTLQSALKNLDTSYQGFFKKKTKFPRFHSKKNKQCIKIPQNFCIENNKLYIPKLKTGIEVVIHQTLPAKQLCCFISKTCSDKYYVSFLCDIEISQYKISKNTIGIDLGIKDLVISSDRLVIENKNFYRKEENNLTFQQKLLSKKKLQSKNREKQRKVLARINERIANRRNDYLHKISSQLINENQVIITENLAVKNMMKNHCLAKSIQDCSWSELLRQLEYKARWYGRTFYKIDRFFPSSKTCNNCQYVLESLDLSVRSWVCPKCKQNNDRDINAAKNIRDKGLLDLKDLTVLSAKTTVKIKKKILKKKLVNKAVLSGCGIQSDIKQKLGEAFSSEINREVNFKKSLRNKKLSHL